MNERVVITALVILAVLVGAYFLWGSPAMAPGGEKQEQGQNLDQSPENGTDAQKSTTTTKPPAAPAKKIRVISPNGGEVWQIGKQYIVRWETNALPETSDIFVNIIPAKSIITDPYLSKVSGQQMFNLSTFPSNEGPYAYTVPQSVKPGTYQVLIFGGKNCNTPAPGTRCEFDLSDRLFT